MKSLLTVLLCGVLLVAYARSAVAQNEDPHHPNWQRYHSTADTYALLEGWANAFPNLTNLYSIGETLEGTPLLVLEITNKETGEALEKPAYYYDGNIHSEELTGAEVALHFAWHVLSHYGEDPRITRLLDTHTLYVRPKFNPDGADLTLTTPHNPRSTPRPYDQDQDGLLDEDPPNDLDHDGAITRMRMPNPNGLWTISPEDPRLMIRHEEHPTGGRYDLYSEGLDDDGDGRFNEDGVGGIDMNRNFPRNWGMEFEQRGAGPYPLSEPETRATIAFLHTHRNVTGVFHGHTSGGFLFRLPSTTSWDDYDLADQRLILELSDKYHTTTGQSVIPSHSNPRAHRHGTLISWSYWDFGVVGFVPEFWGGFGRDYDSDGTVTEGERLRWNKEELGGDGFAGWTPYDHPQLGAVEIGGWRARFTERNPPPHLLEGEIEQYVEWMLWLSEISPRVVIKDVAVRPVGSENVVKVTVVIENEGYLPTHITQRALAAKIAAPVRVMVRLTHADLITGSERTDLGHLQGTRDTQGGGARRTLEYAVRLTGSHPTFSIAVISEKGGIARQEITLK